MGFKNIEGQLARWIEELAVYNMEIVHRPGKDHVNADGLSRIPDPLVQCNYYSYGCDVQDLPCGGCKYCVRANEQWDRFHEEVDDIVPLAVWHISQDESDTEPHEDVTWVEKYTTQDLRKMQLEDDTTAQIIRWLEDDHRPSQAELALASPAIKYFWLLRRQLIVLSVWFIIRGSNNKQAALAIEVEGYWWLQNHCRESSWSIVMINLELDTWG